MFAFLLWNPQKEEEEKKVQLEQYLVCGMNNSESVLCCSGILLSLN
jgi:hypothetical protein